MVTRCHLSRVTVRMLRVTWMKSKFVTSKQPRSVWKIYKRVRRQLKRPSLSKRRWHRTWWRPWWQLIRCKRWKICISHTSKSVVPRRLSPRKPAWCQWHSLYKSSQRKACKQKQRSLLMRIRICQMWLPLWPVSTRFSPKLLVKTLACVTGFVSILVTTGAWFLSKSVAQVIRTNKAFSNFTTTLVCRWIRWRTTKFWQLTVVKMKVCCQAASMLTWLLSSVTWSSAWLGQRLANQPTFWQQQLTTPTSVSLVQLSNANCARNCSIAQRGMPLRCLAQTCITCWWRRLCVAVSCWVTTQVFVQVLS